MLKNKKAVIALLIIPLILLTKQLKLYPEFVENYYSNGLYIYTSKLTRYTLGWLPFSFGDVMYIVLILYCLRWIILNVKRLYKDFFNWLIDVISAVTIIYFAFHLFWAFNYYRQPLHINLNLSAEYTTQELVAVTKKLISKSNSIHNNLAEHDSIKITFPFSKNELLASAPEGYKNLQTEYPQLEYSPKSIKKSLLTYPLSIMGFSGYLNPITNEAQVNSLIPKYKLPTTTSHEIAHQLGYAAENEANFIGYLAATHNPNLYFKYSGYTFGLKHCLREVYKRDQTLYFELLESINTGIILNYKDVQAFWNSYKNPTEPYFKKTYNGYLKANNQEKGMQSYSYVVALLVNHLKNKSL
ncbi:DUF3810 domain-containing protein [Lacinutrix salivirga]